MNASDSIDRRELVHCADVQPAGDRASHHLVVDGAIAARHDTLSAALAARELFLQPLCSDVAPAAAADLPEPKTEKRSPSSHGSSERLSYANKT